jgi:hypothetical protein
VVVADMGMVLVVMGMSWTVGSWVVVRVTLRVDVGELLDDGVIIAGSLPG